MASIERVEQDVGFRTLKSPYNRNMDPKDVILREVLFEMQQVGSYMRVTAVCTRTNIEITMVGDPKLSERALKDAAMRKLKYVIAKEISKRDDGSVIV